MKPTEKTLEPKAGQYKWDLENPLGYGNRMGRYRTRMECEFMRPHLGPPPLRVLDVGGGSGRLGQFFKSLGHRVTVVDNDPQAIAMAEAKGLERAVVGDVLTFDGRDFDVVVAMEMIECFKELGPIFAQCARFIKPGGIFLFCIINARSWRFQFQKFKNNEYKSTAFSLSTVEGGLRTAGFEVVERRGFQWCLAPTGSDSRMVTVSNTIEKWLGLHRWHAQSPWLLYAARKVG